MASVEVLSVTNGTQINSTVLSAITHPMGLGKIASVTTSVSDLPLPQTAETLYVTLKADASAVELPRADGEVTAAPIPPSEVAVRLHLYRDGEQDIRYLGDAVVRVGEWTALAFDIKDYARAASGIDLVRLSVIGSSADANMEYTLTVSDFRYETGAGLIVLRVFLCILAGLLILVLIFAVLVIRAKIIRRRRRRQRAAQRAAYLARQRQLQAQQKRSTQQQPSARNHQVQQPSQNPQKRGAQRRPDMYGRSDGDRRNNRR
jgi:hypothetical protein